ncbi:homoserine O-acetyltransferase [Arthrobacter sp. B0490]|uniref:homoserine O-acetyltransferase MetX n=1 Tax=Arthrobacter sp. B0490 TaxID=2058891 RepID=UPI00215892CC|nr:homoserine O-acetyltransferase [Arthrobacter sp. B0490]
MTTYPAAPLHPGIDGAPSGDGLLRIASIGPLALETGGELPDVQLAFETWGRLDPDGSNAVLVQHALTGSSHVARGASEEEGWWDSLVGPGRTVDTDRYFVVSINMLGGCYGSTGPASPAPDGAPWGSRFPFVTIRDSVRAEALLADQLGVGRWHSVIGGSMGGARALEWALMYAERVARCAVVACTAASSAEQIAFAQAQLQAIRLDPAYRRGDYYDGPHPEVGLGIARRIAHITYRSELELEARFGRAEQDDEQPFGAVLPADRGRYQVESYLDHQAAKLVHRFDANSYVVLTEALMSHDAARGRGTLDSALGDSTSEFFIAAVDSDRLYFPEQSRRLAAGLPGTVPVHMISSPVGHDAFLTQIHQLDDQLRATFYPEADLSVGFPPAGT